ncbi:MAG TPA: hypothetical protein VFE72_07410 [Lysobacter sp.]|nr:hypothetical protein [Lysobacter sp.]
MLALLAGLLHWASRPQQVASLVLSQAGRALGLRITARGVSEYTLRDMPKLVLRDVTAQRDGDATPVLQADRVLLSLPWSTLKSRGRDITVHRIELDRPRLDIGALQRWLATRPPSRKRPAPMLTDGLVVTNGRVAGDGWVVEDISLGAPSLAPGQRVRVMLRGRLVAGATRVPFNLAATLMRPEMPAGLGVAGNVSVVQPDWRLPMDLVLRGLPDLDNGLALDALVLRARARYASRETSLPFALGVAGRASYTGGLHVAPLGLALRRGGAIPDLTGGGRLDWGDSLSVAFDGRIERWPEAWPALPAPLGRPKDPLPTTLTYSGPTNFSGEAALHLESGPTRFDGRFRLPRVLDWLDAPANATPLPPLDGRVSTPRLEIPGATLEGVEVEIVDDDD